jgi:cell wall-associated NlpC family hydrolase
MSIAAVQARIAQIQGQFATVGAVAPPAAPAAASTSFSSALQAQTDLTGAAAGGPLATAAPSLPVPRTASATGAAGATGEAVVAAARRHLGTPYVWGGESPGGFDCSGLVQWAYGQVGVELPRVSRDQAKVGREVSAAQARPGDLVFFERGTVDHIGLYAGAGTWVVAPKTGDVVKVQDVDLSKATTIRRVLPDTPGRATAAASSSPTGVPAGTPFASLFASAGAQHGVSPALLAAVARAESGFDPLAKSPAGAQGLMQFMPATARGLGVDPWKPASAVDGAARLLKQHLQRFGSTELALAAYNAGPGAVTKHGGVPPYAETQKYVAKIMAELRGAS